LGGEKRKCHVGWMNIEMDYGTPKKEEEEGRKQTTFGTYFFSLFRAMSNKKPTLCFSPLFFFCLSFR